jgi:hypothetical protein
LVKPVGDKKPSKAKAAAGRALAEFVAASKRL